MQFNADLENIPRLCLGDQDVTVSDFLLKGDFLEAYARVIHPMLEGISYHPLLI